jgi:hypothetical protein
MMMQVGRQGWRFLIRNWRDGEVRHKGYFAQSRNGNFNHITRSEDRWERSTQRAHGHRRRINMCTHMVDRRHLMEEEPLMPTWQDLAADFFNHNDKTRVVVHFWSVTESGKVWLCREHLEMTLPILTSNQTWPRAAVRKYKINTIAAGSWPRVEHQRYRGISLLSNGLMCPHMINGSGDMLYRSWWILLEFWARQICRELTISKFWPRFEMKTQETLNTNRIDILLRFPSNNCVPCSYKPSNSYGHYKMAWGKILGRDLETYWVFKDGRRFDSRTEPIYQIERKWDESQSLLIGLHVEVRTRNVEALVFP